MTLSLNEVETMARKATRGAGYPWGLAEETGRAVRWLAGRGIDGPAALADLLRQIDGCETSVCGPVMGGATWRAEGTTICPIAAGTALSDRATEILDKKITLGPTACPILILPFAAVLASASGSAIRVEWPGGGAVTNGEDVVLEGTTSRTAPHVNIYPCRAACPPSPRNRRAGPTGATWDTLTAFAERTYAPATESSRMKGAGAGLSDND